MLAMQPQRKDNPTLWKMSVQGEDLRKEEMEELYWAYLSVAASTFSTVKRELLHPT